MTDERFRVAMPITGEFLKKSSELTGVEMDFEDTDMFLIVEIIGPTEFKGTLLSSEQLHEERRRDDTLHILEAQSE